MEQFWLVRGAMPTESVAFTTKELAIEHVEQKHPDKVLRYDQHTNSGVTFIEVFDTKVSGDDLFDTFPIELIVLVTVLK